jgi:O-antigen/teichoic acid export membrane protein
MKLGLPFLFITLGAYGIFLSWTISAVFGLFYAGIVLIMKYHQNFKLVIYDRIIKNIFHFSFGNYIAGLLSTSQNLLLPILITHYLTPTDTAYFYIPMMMAGVIYMIPQSIASTLFAKTSGNSKNKKKIINQAIKLTMYLMIPSMIIMIVLGKWLLSFFGQEYVKNSYEVLIILTITAVFIAIKAIYTTIINLQKNIKKLIILNSVNTVAIILLSIFFVHKGIIGFAYSYMVGQGFILPLIVVMK